MPQTQLKQSYTLVTVFCRHCHQEQSISPRATCLELLGTPTTESVASYAFNWSDSRSRCPAELLVSTSV